MNSYRRTVRVGSVVLDAQAVSLWLDEDREMIATVARLRDVEWVMCANTLIELARHPRHRKLDWLASLVRVDVVTRDVATLASGLLRGAGLTGHSHAIDASVAAVALRQPGRSAIMTSDPEDMYRLCAGRADVWAV